MDDTGTERAIPKELWEKIIFAVYQLCKWGVPVSGAIEISRIIIENYWKGEYADKSGG